LVVGHKKRLGGYRAIQRVTRCSMNSKTANRLQKLYTQGWEACLQENPLLATSTGDHRFNDRLPRVSLKDSRRWAKWVRGFRQKLHAAVTEGIPESEAVNFAIFDRMLEHYLAMFDYHLYLMPITRSSGYYTEFLDLVNLIPFNTVKDYDNFLSRLNGYTAYNSGHMELMTEGMRQGFVPSRVSLEGLDKSLQALLPSDPDSHPLFQPFKEFPAAIPANERTRLVEAARRAILDSILPATRALLDFFQKEYYPAARQTVGIGALPAGDDIYRYMIRYHTTLPVSPWEIHQTGLAEVKRIRAEMDAIITKVGFKGSFQDFIHFLRSDPQFYVDTPAALLEKVALVLKRMDGELPRLFGRLPRTPYGIRQVPEYLAPRTTTAYFFPSSGDGTTAGFYYVNTYDLKSRPLYEIEALSLHEAVPGHHLQISVQQEMKEMPAFRRSEWVTAHGEGWALYAERLGLEVGFYTDPYSDFGRLTYEMWRATRLVVDTGIHALGWTRQQAIDYMAENTALTLLNISNEVDRYIGWPAQALAYKMGEIKIRQLRAHCEQALGSRFDRRKFHDLLLEEGAIPLNVVEQKIERWIAEVNNS
jgi:uncharacterized protein (DUF885 family)